MKKISVILESGSHYRLEIYTLMDKEYDVSFLFSDKKTNIKQIGKRDLTNIAFNRLLKLPFTNFFYLRGALKTAFKSDKVIIGGLPYILTDLLILLLLKLTKKEVIIWTHGYYGNESKLKAIFKKLYYSLADVILVYNERSKSYFLKNKFKKRVEVIYNSFNYDLYKSLRQTSKKISFLDNKNPNVIFVGRLEKNKKIDLLLRACYYLKNKNVLFNVILIGEGRERKYLEGLSGNLNIGNQIYFHGAEYNQELVHTFFRSAKVTVSPGNVGLLAITSISSGTPVISHNNFCNQMPEYEAIEKGVTGDFFEEGNIESLANTIEKWLSLDSLKNEENCYRIIDDKWNPNNQMNILKKIL